MFLQSIKLGGPYQVLAVCKYVIVPTTIGRTCLKITKTRFGYISGYPTHFKRLQMLLYQGKLIDFAGIILIMLIYFNKTIF